MTGAIVTWIILGLGACGGDDGGGGGGGTDSGVTDAGGDGGSMGDPWNAPGERRPFPDTSIDGEQDPDNRYEPLPGSTRPPDFSCDGMHTAPAEGSPISFTFHVQDFQEDTPTSGVCVKFFPDNVVTDAPCMPGSGTDFMTDMMGDFTVMDAAGSWYAYRIFPRMGATPATTVVGSVQINEPAPMMAGGRVVGNSVSQATINLIPAVLGFGRVAGTGLIAGTAYDCDQEPLYGVQVRLFTADRTPIVEGTRRMDPHFRYFDGEDFPSADQPWTHVDGLFAVGNIPVPADNQPIYVETWGRQTPGGPVEMIGCERIRVFADTVAIVNVMPKRMDGPMGCSQ
ncbi:MAG: hypothetical protein NZ898_06660 [Myxococcota bacterium]|nr:hypothetical protein [Myxococcota bacterium]MDW8361822.1 hypothetical protein [Myxococcales bacterium]